MDERKAGHQKNIQGKEPSYSREILTDTLLLFYKILNYN